LATERLERACSIALVAPLLLAAVAIVCVSIGEAVGAAPWSGPVPRNSAEAAAMGSASDVLRFLHAGEDPRAVYDIRPEVISSAILRATTLEAAMWSRQREMVELMDREGAIGQSDRERLACLAADLKIDDIVEYLAPGGAHCDPGKALARVADRTSGPAS
jgi:hypothetical protein